MIKKNLNFFLKGFKCFTMFVLKNSFSIMWKNKTPIMILNGRICCNVITVHYGNDIIYSNENWSLGLNCLKQCKQF